ncbi:PPC domain-containing protein [Cystobacter ferrugineus]|uniref:Peptidase C-terminal archaeal/bacterial domain-containing protein n=1 Tax=Cystobacter ferrugineus TaxID=83449 RepID=A0A1L9BKS6_9BACT|nr:PPC domain-containing protein [Cystobacter ferrugineus]OJH42768.1 hypothetical protein BON30_06210 [Cystobacter ferrugineus]
MTLPGTELKDAVPVTVSGAQNSLTQFFVNVPAGLQEISFALMGGSDVSGSAELLIKRGAVPTTSSYDCRSRESDEARCNVQSPASDTWGVVVRGMTDYANVKLVVYFNLPNPLPLNSVLWVRTSQPTMYFVDIPAGKGRLKFENSRGTVKVRLGARPTDTLFDCSGTCDILAPTGGRYYVLLSNQTSGTQLSAWVTGAARAGGALTNGQTVTGLSINRDDVVYYTLNVPTGQARLVMETSVGGLPHFVQRGNPFPGKPVSCLPSGLSGSGACTFSNPQAGTWYVAVHSPTSTISSMSLTVRAVASTWNGTVTPLSNYQQVTGLSGSPIEDRYYSIQVPEGMPKLSVKVTQQTGSAEVYVQHGTRPLPGQGTACHGGCTLQAPAAGTWYILIRGFTTFSGLSFSAGYPPVAALTPGQPVTYGSSLLHYYIDIPEGQLEANFTLATEQYNSASVKYGTWSTGGGDGCSMPCRLYRPQAGRYYVTVYYVSGIVFGTLEAWYAGGPVGTLEDGAPAAFTSGSGRELRYWRIDVPEGQAQLRVDLAFQRSTQVQLYVRRGDVPATFQSDCQGAAWAYNFDPPGRTCIINQPQAGPWYVLAYSDAELDAVLRATTSSGVPTLTPGFDEKPSVGSAGEEQLWKMEVPAGVSDLRVKLSGGTGNADLYMRYGERPDATLFDCASANPNNEENCELVNPRPGTWYVAVRGAAAWSGARMVATLASTPGEGIRALASGENAVGLKGAPGSIQYFKVEVPQGQARLVVGLSGGRGNADLSVRREARPTLSVADCRSQDPSNSEVCVFENPAPGTWLIRVDGTGSFAEAVLTARYNLANEAIVLTPGVPAANIYIGPNEVERFTFYIPTTITRMRIDVQAGVNSPGSVQMSGSALTCDRATPSYFTLCPYYFFGGGGVTRTVSIAPKVPSSASWGNTVTLVTGVDGWDDDVTHPSLLNGVALVDLSENVRLKIDVPEGARKLTVITQGPTGTSSDPGEVDLYILNLKPPTTTKYTCRSDYVGIKQSCTITNPSPGSWYIQTYLTSGTYDVKATYE